MKRRHKGRRYPIYFTLFRLPFFQILQFHIQGNSPFRGCVSSISLITNLPRGAAADCNTCVITIFGDYQGTGSVLAGLIWNRFTANSLDWYFSSSRDHFPTPLSPSPPRPPIFPAASAWRHSRGPGSPLPMPSHKLLPLSRAPVASPAPLSPLPASAG